MVTLQRGQYSKFKEIGRYDSKEKAMEAMMLLLNLERYNVYYSRSWEDDDGWTIVDYGSHRDFFRYKEDQQ
jgi:hypothetical protein